jgi:hypothetical protein
MINHIRDERKQVSVFLLTVMKAVINEQVSIKQLKKDVGDYIYQAVKDQAIGQGWIE